MDEQVKFFHDALIFRAYMDGINVFQAAADMRTEMQEAGIDMTKHDNDISKAAYIAAQTIGKVN